MKSAARLGVSANWTARMAVPIELHRFVLLTLLFGATSWLGFLLGTPGLPMVHFEWLLAAPLLDTMLGRIWVALALIVACLRVVQNLFGFDQLFVSSYLLLHNLTGFPPLLVFAGSAAVLSIIGGLCLLLWRLPRRVVRVPASVVALAVLVLVGLKATEDHLKLNLVGTSSGYLLGSVKFSSMFHRGYSLPAPQGLDSPARRGAEYATERQQNYLFILVESMGSPRDAALRASMLSPFDSPRLHAAFDVTYGETPARGSTIHGEIRELCGGRLAQGLFESGNDHCLPAVMQRNGYTTTAIHANKAGFYGRNIWYPKIGFQHYINADGVQLPRHETANRWGSLLDPQTIEFATRHLSAASDRQFLYLLTVSTHVPAEPLPGTQPDADCLMKIPSQACTHISNLRLVLADIGKAALALRNTTIVLVGDHPPPFFAPSSRGAFSGDSVPYVMLTPHAPPGIK